MKREIIGKKCMKEKTNLFKEVSGDQEWTKNVKGIAKGNYLCDFCGFEIKKGEICYARSIVSRLSSNQYYSWEDDYINTNPVLIKLRESN